MNRDRRKAADLPIFGTRKRRREIPAQHSREDIRENLVERVSLALKTVCIVLDHHAHLGRHDPIF